MSHDYEVVESREVFDGRVISLRTDQVRQPGGEPSQRDVVVHPGAVGVVALDDDGAVVLVEQYRHPVRRRLLELPAGLLDVAGEDPLTAAQRELVEEVGLEAAEWHVLLDALTSPGMSDEAIRVYLARGLTEVEQPEAEHEEADMTVSRLPLAELVRRALAGELENGMCVMGVLAAAAAERDGWRGLRPADAPWRAKEL